MQRYLSFVLLTFAAGALCACASGGADEQTPSIPHDSHVRIENPEALTYALHLGHVDGVRTYGARIVVEGGEIASFERDDTALKSGGGQVLPLSAHRTPHTLNIAAGTTIPVDIEDARLATITVMPDGDESDIVVRADISGDDLGVIDASGQRVPVRALSSSSTASAQQDR